MAENTAAHVPTFSGEDKDNDDVSVFVEVDASCAASSSSVALESTEHGSQNEQSQPNSATEEMANDVQENNSAGNAQEEDETSSPSRSPNMRTFELSTHTLERTHATEFMKY